MKGGERKTRGKDKERNCRKEERKKQGEMIRKGREDEIRGGKDKGKAKEMK